LPPGATYDQIKYTVPNISEVPTQKILPWFNSRVPLIQVEIFPLTP